MRPDEQRPAPHFLLVGNGPYLNRGCEAIVRGTMAILRQEFGSNVSATVASVFLTRAAMDWQIAREDDPAVEHVAIDRWFTDPAPRYTWRWALQAARRRVRSDKGSNLRVLDGPLKTALAALQVGGDNYSQPASLPLRHMAMDRYIRRVSTVPLVLWGASVGPFVGFPYLVRKVIRHMNSFSGVFLRESQSQQYLAEHGVVGNVHMAGDPSFLMEPEPVADLSLGDALERGAVGLNLSPLLGRHVAGGDAQRWRDIAVATAVAIRRKTGRPLVLVPHVTVPVTDDHRLLSDVAMRVRADGVNDVWCMGRELGAAQTKWVVGKCEVFVGARMHAAIAAISSCVPTILLAYSQKARGLTDAAYGVRDYCIEPSDFTPEAVSAKVCWLLDRAEEVRQHLRTRVPELRAAAARMGPLLRTIVETVPS